MNTDQNSEVSASPTLPHVYGVEISPTEMRKCRRRLIKHKIMPMLSSIAAVNPSQKYVWYKFRFFNRPTPWTIPAPKYFCSSLWWVS
jgi:hypothetical protein